ncbi:PD40 domain-containing protein [Gillisia sp. Hel_I_86]|uniref:PD40 domain-containing protein n=1 Tax=Gillisia sp. Hel_I_86 TaxID=1249981 RepID=UPI0011A08C5A|nr:PD40 domain-containing protein [Gillisia sp. Hel_I_86]
MQYNLLSIFCFLFFIMNLSAQTPEPVDLAFPELLSEFQNIRDFSMASDGTELFFTAQSHLGELSIIVQAIKKNSSWETKLFLPHSGKYKDLEPFLSPDGLKLYFASNRPFKNESEIKTDFDIWYLERKSQDDKWSDPINIGTSVNTEFHEFYPPVAANENLYFTSDRPEGKGKDDIYKSEWNSNSYKTPISLSDSINSEGYEFNAYISPKEDFLIFSGYDREDGLGSGDLYKSTRLKDGQLETIPKFRHYHKFR